MVAAARALSHTKPTYAGNLIRESAKRKGLLRGRRYALRDIPAIRFNCREKNKIQILGECKPCESRRLLTESAAHH
jgi:hypothetical protein